DKDDFGIYSLSAAAAASPPKVGRSTLGWRTTKLCPMDSFGISPTFLRVNSTGSPALTRMRSVLNFIWSLPSTVHVLDRVTFSIPGTVSVAVASSVVSSVVAWLSVLLEVEELLQATNVNPSAKKGITNNFFMFFIFSLTAIKLHYYFGNAI